MRKLNWILLALSFPLSALAQTAVHRIETIPTNPAPGSAFQIRVSGQWPNTCAPEVMPVVVDGVNIDVSLRQRDQICGDAVTPYSMTVDPASAVGGGFPSASVFRVRLSLLAFRIVDATASTRDIRPEAGFWSPDTAGEFRTSGSGIGFMVERQGATLAMTTNAYTLGGQAAWYLSAGLVERSSFRAELLRSIGGQPLWGTYRGLQAVEPAGTVDIEFASNASAVIWFARPSGEGIFDQLDLMPISVRRMNFALAADGQALDGVWSLSAVDSNSSVDPETLHFAYRNDRSQSTEAVLTDDAKGFELRCTIDAERRDAPPSVCRLLAGGIDRARFDNNALTRLSGRSDTGEALLLVRLGD
jgi:hypothetical protein